MEFCSEHALVMDRLDRDAERLNAHAQSIDEMQKMLSTLTMTASQNAALLEKMDKRMCELEAAPVKKYNTVFTIVLTAVITALVTILVGQFIPA